MTPCYITVIFRFKTYSHYY